MIAQKSTASRLGIAPAINSFVLKILHVTTFDSRFCKRENGSAATKVFISKILQKGYIEKILHHYPSVFVEPLRLPLCVE